MLITVVALAQGAGASATAVPSGAPPDELAPLRPFRQFTRQDGLPQNTVSAMVEDAEGVLWLGTLDGLATFDGARIVEVGTKPGAPSLGAIYALSPRSLGGVYVGTNAGLYVRDAAGAWQYLGNQRAVASVAEEAPGTVWVVDQQGGLWHVTDDGGVIWQAVPLPPPSGPATAAQTRADGGPVWVVTRSALLRVDPPATPRIVATVPDGARLTALAVDRTGVPWVGVADGKVARWSGDALVETPGGCAGNVPVTALTDDWRGRIWVGCADGRLAVGSSSGPWSLWGSDEGMRLGARVIAITTDRHGHLWIGRNGLGATQLVSERWRHRAYWAGAEPRLPGEGIMGITALPGGGAAIGVFARGVWYWDGKRVRQIGAEAGLVENTRFAVEPRPGVLWVGGRYGLYESAGGAPFRRVLSIPSGFVNAVVKAPDGTWYALTQVAGLYALRGSQWVPEEAINARLPHQNLRGATWLRSGDLWLATGSGLAVVRDGQVSTVDVAINGQPFVANAVLELPNGDIWVGALGGLLVRHGGAWHRLGPEDGLPGRSIYSLIQTPDGAIWAGGSAGVGRYRDGVWRVFDRHSGLVEDECTLGSLLALPDGRVLVGTMASLAVYDPSVPEPPVAPLRVLWRSTPAPGADGIARLPKGERSVRLSWSAPWLSPDPIEYRWRMLPGSGTYSEPSARNDLDLVRLDAGRWTVEVQARIGGAQPGAWTDPIRLALDIPPYFHESWWVRLIGVLLVAGLIPLGIRLRTAQLVRRQQALEQAVESALADVKTLTGLLPICASCKRIRDGHGAWNPLETYLKEHSDATLSHGICPDCMAKLYPDYTERH